MLDRVKEALFSIIGPRLDGQKVLDLFAGSGSLGIEALSRGAEFCVFIEQSHAAASVLKKNLEKTHVAERARVLMRDALRGLPADACRQSQESVKSRPQTNATCSVPWSAQACLRPQSAGLPADAILMPSDSGASVHSGAAFTIVFADPPYELVRRPDGRQRLFGLLSGLAGKGILAPGALAMIHHEPAPAANWVIAGMELKDERVYGRSQLTFFRVSSSNNAGSNEKPAAGQVED